MKMEERIYLVPKNTKNQIRNNIAKNSPEHLQDLEFFVEKICKNKDVKNILIDKQNNICPWCGKKLLIKGINNNFVVIHHINYNHICVGPKSKTYSKKKIIDIPNCLCCENIKECLKDLAVIHNTCNAQINDFQLKELSSGNLFTQERKNLSLEEELIHKIKTKFKYELKEEELFKGVCNLYNNSPSGEKSRITAVIKTYLKEKHPVKYQRITETNVGSCIKSFLYWGLFGLIQSNEIGTSQKLLCLPEDFSWLKYCFNDEELNDYINNNKDMLSFSFPCFKDLFV